MSWTTTIQPLGDGPFNTEGLQHYHNVVIAYNEAGVSVMVELYHWDLPQSLQDLGEWFNSTIVDKLAIYADTCFQEYGLKVLLALVRRMTHLNINKEIWYECR